MSEEARKNKKKIIYRLKHRKLCMDAYVIALPYYNNNLLDIYPAKELIQPYYKKADIHIIGLATSLDDAKEVVTDIIEEVYTKTNDFKIREYLGFGTG